MYAICDFEELARGLVLTLPPLHLQVTGEVYIHVDSVNVYLELVVEALLHRRRSSIQFIIQKAVPIKFRNPVRLYKLNRSLSHELVQRLQR